MRNQWFKNLIAKCIDYNFYVINKFFHYSTIRFFDYGIDIRIFCYNFTAVYSFLKHNKIA